MQKNIKRFIRLFTLNFLNLPVNFLTLNNKHTQQHMKKLPFALGALTLAMFFSCTKDIQQDATTNDAAGSAANSNAVAENPSDPFVPNEILVKFKAGTSEDGKNKAFSRISAKVKDKILTKAMKHFGSLSSS